MINAIEKRLEELRYISNSLSVDALFNNMLLHSSDFMGASENLIHMAKDRTADYLCKYTEDLINSIDSFESYVLKSKRPPVYIRKFTKGNTNDTELSGTGGNGSGQDGEQQE